MKQLSIIMPHYNDVETLMGTISELYETIDVSSFELIVVNDGSKFRLPEDYAMRKNMRYVEHFVNLGVGQAFDTGVRLANSDNIILMGADVRFKKNGWASRMLSVIKQNQTSIIATACGSTTSDVVYYGADVMFLVKNKDLGLGHPRKHIEDYTSVLEGKWRPRTSRGVYEVPCLMGAFYGVKKSWYEKIRGFELHYKWGGLEPYISLKTWKMGGSVLVDSDNITYHIFNRKPQRDALWDVLAYNQLMIANTVFSQYGIKYAEFLWNSGTSAYERGSEMMMEKMEAISQLTQYIISHSVMTPQELEKKMVEMSFHYNQEECKYTNPLLHEYDSVAND
jgi:glycosyltransferase involved in cell wall biosynthesis